MAWLSQISVGVDYATQVAPPMVLIGIGMGTAFTPLTSAGIGVLITVFAAARKERAGAADVRRPSEPCRPLA